MFKRIITKAVSPLVNCQQVRFGRRTFLARYAYGDPPITKEEQLEEYRADKDKAEKLEFTKIRFAHLYENCSPLHDPDYEKFVRFAMSPRGKQMALSLCDQSLYLIKSIQFKKLKKQQEKIRSGKLKEEEAEQVEMNPMEVLKQALKNCEPAVVVKPVKRGGATYQVPYPLQQSQSEYYATKWMIKAVMERPKPREKHFPEVMAQELLDAFYKRGKVIKRRDDMHRQADANRAFAHYRWG